MPVHADPSGAPVGVALGAAGPGCGRGLITRFAIRRAKQGQSESQLALSSAAPGGSEALDELSPAAAHVVRGADDSSRMGFLCPAFIAMYRLPPTRKAYGYRPREVGAAMIFAGPGCSA